MKKILVSLAFILAIPLVAHADNTIVYASPGAPYSGRQQTCVSLSAALGCTVTQITIDQGGVRWMVTCTPDWNPSPTQIAQLTSLINAGQ